jgi:hypothetical protein
MIKTRKKVLEMTKAELGSLMTVAASIHHRLGLKLHILPGGIKLPGIYDVKEYDEAEHRMNKTNVIIEVTDHAMGRDCKLNRDY